MTLNEGELVEFLASDLEASGHLTFREVTLTRSLLDMAALGDTPVQKRIDLAALNKYDGQILFLEAEREFTVKHPLSYRPFADFTYLVAPMTAYREVPEQVRQEQVTWAQAEGLGIILVEGDGRSEVLVSAKRNPQLSPEVRGAVRAMMRVQDPLSTTYPPMPPFTQ
ncbi:MAG: hypothetical protein ACE5OZ_01335 [Candidatus Heimdallarchaeota archaeon]